MLLDKVTTRLLGAIPEMDAAGLHTLVRRPLGLLQMVQWDYGSWDLTACLRNAWSLCEG